MNELSLFDELIKCLDINHKTWDDIIHIYGYNYRISKDNFRDLAKNIYCTYGIDDYYTKVAEDLKLKGDNFIILRVRFEWVYIDLPKTPKPEKSEINFYDDLLVTLGENYSRLWKFEYGNCNVLCNDRELVFLYTDEEGDTEWYYTIYDVPDSIRSVDRITSYDEDDSSHRLKELQIKRTRFSIEAIFSPEIRKYMESFEVSFKDCFKTAFNYYPDIFLEDGRKIKVTDIESGKSIILTINLEEESK